MEIWLISLCTSLIFISQPTTIRSSFLNKTPRTTSYIQKSLHEAIYHREEKCSSNSYLRDGDNTVLGK
jgi:hypothetical protein